MAETDKQRVAKSYVAGAVAILEDLQNPYGGTLKGEDLAPAMKLLESAAELVDGKDEKREAKRAADRARRAKPKPKPKASRRKFTPGAFAAPRSAGETD